MLFDNILGHDRIIQHLKNSVDNNRISHAQLFSGPEGVGVLQVAYAYAQYILCHNSKDKEACEAKVAAMSHPDLHTVFPVGTTKEHTTKPISDNFIKQINEFVKEEKFPSIIDWYSKIGIENKVGLINTEESAVMIRKMNLSAYEGGFKVMIIWLPELMNSSSANKLLKMIEEPNPKSVFILVTEDKGSIISTLTSRCQAIEFNRLADSDIITWIELQYGLDKIKSADIAIQAEGSVTRAIKIIEDNSLEEDFQDFFVKLVRASFKMDAEGILKQTDELAGRGKQFSFAFLDYCIRVFRQAMLENYHSKDLSFLKIESGGFNFESFVSFVHGRNILQIIEALETAIYHLERNGNAKIVLFDLFISIYRGLHTKYK
jgi:DNA polymerase III subunit delta'